MPLIWAIEIREHFLNGQDRMTGGAGEGGCFGGSHRIGNLRHVQRTIS